MRIVVLVKPVPDNAAGTERIGSDGRVDRDLLPAVINGNDEYAVEAGLQLVGAVGGDVTVLAMAPDAGAEALRKALAMGADRAIVVSDRALAGSCVLTTARTLAQALRGLQFDLVLAGASTSDGGAGSVPAAVATLLGVPYVSDATKIEAVAGGIRVRRVSSAGSDVVEAPLPALVLATQEVGEPRYPSLKGIMAARHKEIVRRTLTDLGLEESEVGSTSATTRLVGTEEPAPRREARHVEGLPADVARELVAFLEELRLVR